MKINIVDEGLKDYEEMHAIQKEIFSSMVEKKKHGIPITEEFLFIVEHTPVITFGKHAKSSNLLISGERASELGVGIYNIERGGDVTYHGPGQIVIYPIIDMELHHLGVKDYVHLLEEAVIMTLEEFHIKGERVQGASGVWIDAGTDQERKICALGVKCSRFVTMHGLALNVNTDLSGFRMINPCGFIDKGVTSMAQELGKEIDMAEVKKIMILKFQQLIGF
ncbi:MAG: lipoyl(octanoyl) transferase LipB [Muribaculaceae bacterium]|nr:lipoyl(octanoyl) transferase LipB [Muribaculaceae bacterium]